LPDTPRDGSLDHISGAFYIDGVICDVVIAASLTVMNLRSEMEHRVDTSRRGFHGTCIAHVAGRNFDTGWKSHRLSTRSHNSPDGMPLLTQSRDEVSPDKSVRTCYQRLHDDTLTTGRG
jgi:hypothetical protein